MEALKEKRKKHSVTKDVEEAPERVTGPLGIWPFPLLEFIQTVRVRKRRAIIRTPVPPQAYLPKVASRRVEYIRDPKTGRIIEKYEEIEVT